MGCDPNLTSLEWHWGASPDGLQVIVDVPADGGGKFNINVERGGLKARLTGLIMDPDSDHFLPTLRHRST